MPRTTQAYDHARRGQILEAAYRCFSERGLHGTTMQAVAAEAGLSVGALYRYFDGKEALFAALAERAGERRSRLFGELEEGHDPGRLARLVAGLMEEMESPEALPSVRLDIRLWAEALDDPALAGAVRSAFESIREPVASHLLQAQRSGEEASRREPEAVGRVVISLLVGLELQRAHDGELDVEAYRETVRTMLSAVVDR